MITGIHFILSYKCTSECDHCFVFGSPQAEGTFTLSQIKQVFAEIEHIDSISAVYFEGGEPFLFYPLLTKGLVEANKRNLKKGIVTNAYWAISEDVAELYLKPLLALKINDLSISYDSLHDSKEEGDKALIALKVAQKLGIPASTISTDSPFLIAEADTTGEDSPIGGDVMFRGRAVSTLTDGLPSRNWTDFNHCPHEDLLNPERVHIDACGNVHLCQGLSIGNMWENPLSQLIQEYDGKGHPVASPLIAGGPAQLKKHFDLDVGEVFLDACHLCYCCRKELVGQYPELLGPKWVYGETI
jgi:hypothetical protein